jgi:plastocyanin
MQKTFILLFITAFLLVAAGCTDPAPEAPATPVPPTVESTPPVTVTTPLSVYTTRPSVNDNTVKIFRDRFEPETITVKRGATVRWVNMDSTEDPALYNPTHRIKIENVYTAQTLSPGQGWSWIFTDPGVYNYQDLVHPELRGTVQVEV